MAQYTKKEFDLKIDLQEAILRLLSDNTTIRYEYCSKLAVDIARDIIDSVRVLGSVNTEQSES